MKKISGKQLRYNAIYGAMIAAQVQDLVRDGGGAPDYSQMRRFVEEAYAVADLAEEVQQWEPSEEEEDIEAS